MTRSDLGIYLNKHRPHFGFEWWLSYRYTVNDASERDNEILPMFLLELFDHVSEISRVSGKEIDPLYPNATQFSC